MYTTTNSSNKHCLKAADAANRAMKRMTCCKSQFKLKCFSCGEIINRGDKITKCMTTRNDGMDLRFRGSDIRNGLKQCDVAFYMAETGTRAWVHIGCNPCYWDSLPEDSNEYSPSALHSVYTAWGAKIAREFEEWVISSGFKPQAFDFQGNPQARIILKLTLMEEFLVEKGYPQEKCMSQRINHAVTRFQAIWRGYLYKRAFPFALKQKKATETRNFKIQALKDAYNTIYSEYLEEEQNDALLETRPWSADSVCSATKEGITLPNVKDHCEILFNYRKNNEAIYSCEVMRLGNVDPDAPDVIAVKYHHDGDIRYYHWRRFDFLKKECENHKKNLGIEAKLIGRLNTFGMSVVTQTITLSPTHPK